MLSAGPGSCGLQQILQGPLRYLKLKVPTSTMLCNRPTAPRTEGTALKAIAARQSRQTTPLEHTQSQRRLRLADMNTTTVELWEHLVAVAKLKTRAVRPSSSRKSELNLKPSDLEVDKNLPRVLMSGSD